MERATKWRGSLTARPFLVSLLLALAAVFLALGGWGGDAAARRGPKFIFIFLGDGAGIGHLEIARLYSREIRAEPFTITERVMREGFLGLLTTHALDALTTDSAAAATALAAGCKTRNGMSGACPSGMTASVLEKAKERGMRIGLVTNAPVYDASPAAFAAHVSDRRSYGAIVEQYLELEPDLLLGGGRDYFLPRSQPGSRRRDNKDLIALFRKKGYRYVQNRRELEEAKGPRLLGLFALGEMSLEIDRDRNAEPSVREMTAAALRILSQDLRRGFVLFVENENIDTAAHLSDAAAVIHDFRDFDRAVALAYDFYLKHPKETLLLVTADHDTGGLAFAKDASGDAKLAGLEKLGSLRLSIRRALERLGDPPNPAALDRLMAEEYRGFVLAPDLREAILQKKSPGRPFYSNPLAANLGLMIAHNTQTYWLTAGHTNQPVFVAALGVGAERFRGYQDNSDFGRHLLALLD